MALCFLSYFDGRVSDVLRPFFVLPFFISFSTSFHAVPRVTFCLVRLSISCFPFRLFFFFTFISFLLPFARIGYSGPQRSELQLR